ncbi:MAG: hypothetical protein M5U35_04875 [Roseovarius sp.]|nr:hypothetical protein [Roseovarius sp.]
MRIPTLVAVAALAAVTALPAFAGGVRVYTVPTNANYCPAGLQPVSIDGSISCGQPNTHVTWYEMKRHPVRWTYHSRAVTCAEGQKGCG